jgi:hypothetical protein
VPFNDKANGTGYHFTGMPGWKGEVQQIYRAGSVKSVKFAVVYRGDFWSWRPTRMETPEFEPITEDRNRENLWKVYAYAEMMSGGISQVVVFNRSEVYRAKDKSKTKEFWNSEWEPEMWLKDLALDTPIPTCSGWSTMGQLTPGDVVFDRDGQPVTVTAKSTVKHDKPCFEIQFTTGPPIVCGDDHVWVARIQDRREGPYTTAELAAAKAAGRRVVIPVTDPLDLPDADLPVDPWVLGYWLGNGSRGSGSVACHGDDTAEVVAAIASAGYPVGTVRPDPRANAATVGIHRLAKPLAELGVLGDKHVPAVYLRGSFGQRLALLRGLMDSDGSTWQRKGTAGRAQFTSTRPGLRDAVAELARSLGEQVMCAENDSTGFGKTVRAYSVSWTPTAEIPFALTRKAARSRLRVNRQGGHRVKSVAPVAPVPVACIAVDSPTRTYLAGRDMVPTHNTALHRLFDYVPHSAGYNLQLMQAWAVALERYPSIQLGAGDDTPMALDPATSSAGPQPVAGSVVSRGPVAPVMPGNGQQQHSDPGGNQAPFPGGAIAGKAEHVEPKTKPAAKTAAKAEPKTPAEGTGAHDWPDVPLDGKVSKPTAGKLGAKWTSVGWTGDEYKEQRRVMAGLLAAGKGGQPLDLRTPAQMLEGQARTAILTFEAVCIAATRDGEQPADRLQRMYDEFTAALEQAAAHTETEKTQ